MAAAPAYPRIRHTIAAIPAAMTRAVRTPFSGPNMNSRLREVEANTCHSGLSMRRVVPVLILMIAVVACLDPASQTTTIGEPGTTTSTSVAATTDPSTTPTSTTTTSPEGPPVAWLAPSGVPVAVTAAKSDSVEILTPCGKPGVLFDGQPVYDVDVVIDPGHGGPIDTGAVGRTGLAEKEINLRVSLAVADLLRTRGIATMLTRSGDYPIPIRTRVEYARLMHAKVLVSIHHNAPAAPASTIPGVEVFVQDGSTESQRLGGLLYDRTMDALREFEVDWQRAPDAGVMTVLNSEGRDAYGMVRLPVMPSALIELGYIANGAEAELYQRPNYVSVSADAVADAVEEFLTSEKTGAPLVEGRIFNPASGVGADQCIEPDLELSLYPDVVAVDVVEGSQTHSFEVTISSPYDGPDRYADAFRVIGDDGQVYGIRELTHDHAAEQPFTRSLGGMDIPDSVQTVTIEARDLVYGWGGDTVTVELP